MYALLYDEHRLDRPRKRVVSVHDSREAAEVALDERRERLGRRIWECYTRIVWTASEVHSGDFLGPGEYQGWRPGERVPEGEIYADTD